MQKATFFLFIVLLLSITNCNNTNSDPSVEDQPLPQTREFYQLKMYTFDTDEQVETTDKYLKEALLPGLKKQGIGQVGVFKLRPSETDSSKKNLCTASIFFPRTISCP